MTAIATLILGACASSPNTFSNADPDVDFSQYQSYDFLAKLSTDEPEYSSIVSSFLKVALAQELDRRGMNHDEKAPQLMVNFHIASKEKIISRSVPSISPFDYYDYRDPFYDPWVGYGTYETRVEQYTEGTLHIDFVDAASNQLVWEGAVVGRVTDKHIHNLETTIDNAVVAIMQNFPIDPEATQ